MIEMKVREACRILQVEDGDSAREIRKKYLRLIKTCHPDNQGASELDPRVLNEAYHLLLERRTSERAEDIWDAEICQEAFCERTVYLSHTFPDGSTYTIPMARGGFLWNPEAEDFPMLLKSVYEAAHRIVGSEDPVLFHYLLQEFIDPVYALEHMHAKSFRCMMATVVHGRGSMKVCASASNLFAVDDEGKHEIRFRDKSLYYVISPLVAAGAAQAAVEDGRLTLALTGRPFVRDFRKANAWIRERQGR